MCQRKEPKITKLFVSGLVSKGYFKRDFQIPTHSLFEKTHLKNIFVLAIHSHLKEIFILVSRQLPPISDIL